MFFFIQIQLPEVFAIIRPYELLTFRNNMKSYKMVKHTLMCGLRFVVCSFVVAVAVAVAVSVAVQMREKRKPQIFPQIHQNRQPQTEKPSCGFVAVLFAVAVVGRF